MYPIVRQMFDVSVDSLVIYISVEEKRNKLTLCYGRLLIHAWLLPDSNTIPNICVRDNSL